MAYFGSKYPRTPFHLFWPLLVSPLVLVVSKGSSCDFGRFDWNMQDIVCISLKTRVAHPEPPNGWQMVCGMTSPGCFGVICQPLGHWGVPGIFLFVLCPPGSSLPHPVVACETRRIRSPLSSGHSPARALGGAGAGLFFVSSFFSVFFFFLLFFSSYAELCLGVVSIFARSPSDWGPFTLSLLGFLVSPTRIDESGKRIGTLILSSQIWRTQFGT